MTSYFLRQEVQNVYYCTDIKLSVDCAFSGGSRKESILDSSSFLGLLTWVYYGSDHELPIAKFRLKLKKVGKTARSFRYELNQLPYDYTVEVTSIFKELDLTDRVPEELWTEVHDTVQEAGIKTIPKKKKCKKAKWLYEES